jgi:hypothetical protein
MQDEIRGGCQRQGQGKKEGRKAHGVSTQTALRILRYCQSEETDVLRRLMI